MEKETKCKICNCKTYEIKVKSLIYHHCKNCEFVFLDSKFQPSFNEAKKRYLCHENCLEDKGYVKMLESFISCAVSSFKKNGECLEYGSGPEPVLSKLLEKKGFEVDIYDLHFANDKSFLKKKYDVITATEVFEHLDNPLDVIEKLNSVLDNGGIISVMTLFLPKDISEFEKWWYITDETHISFFSKKTFEYISLKFGFRILYCNDKNVCVFVKV